MTENYKSFVDLNIWLYDFIAEQDAQKSAKARELTQKHKDNICLSTQFINEVCINLSKKAEFKEDQIKQLIARFYFDYEVIELNQKILLTASDLRRRYPLSFWDGLIVASALFADAEILYSEDMQNGLVIEKKLRIINPFL